MSRKANTYTPLKGYHIRETDKAILFEVHEVNGVPISGGPRQLWFPVSQMESQTYDSKEGDGELDTLVMSDWIIQQKDLL